MSDLNYKKVQIDDGNGHEWFEIQNSPVALIGKSVCSKCGYMRRLDEFGTPINKTCKGPVRVSLRQSGLKQ